MAEDEAPRVYAFFDYNCPWSYVGYLRAQHLAKRFELELVWCPWELHPSLDPEGRPTPGVQGVGTDPVEGPMGDLAEELDEVFYWPPVASNTRRALRGGEHVRDQAPGSFPAYHDALFEAIWQEGENVGDRQVLASIAAQVGLDDAAFMEAIEDPAHDERLALVDRKAQALGLVRRPTFVFGDQRIAGTAAFEPSLVGPVGAFTERWERYGAEHVTSLEEDKELAVLR